MVNLRCIRRYAAPVAAPVAALIIATLLAACASSEAYMPLDLIKDDANLTTKPYHIGTGDELELKFFFAPELNDHVTVAPDGTISMMFVPSAKAAGLTLAQLSRSLKHQLEPHVKQPDMAIIVRNFASQKAYVAGEVAKPGAVQLHGTETVMQVLSDAGWITPAAGTDKVVLMRRGYEGDAPSPEVYAIDFSSVLDASDMSQNVAVQAGDVILVPPSGAVKADRWIDQHIRQMIPLSSSAGIAYNINPAVR